MIQGSQRELWVNSEFRVLKGLVDSVENGKSWSEAYFDCAGKRITIKDSEQISEDDKIREEDPVEEDASSGQIMEMVKPVPKTPAKRGRKIKRLATPKSTAEGRGKRPKATAHLPAQEVSGDVTTEASLQKKVKHIEEWIAKREEIKFESIIEGVFKEDFLNGLINAIITEKVEDVRQKNKAATSIMSKQINELTEKVENETRKANKENNKLTALNERCEKLEKRSKSLEKELNDMKADKIAKEQQEPIKSRSEVVQSQNGEDDKLVGAEAMTPFPQRKRDSEGKATAPPPSANRPTEAKPREALYNERKIEKLNQRNQGQ